MPTFVTQKKYNELIKEYDKAIFKTMMHTHLYI